MSDSSPVIYARWKELLLISDTTTDEIYDADQGVHQCVFRAFGFHDEYDRYSSSNSTQRKIHLKGEGHNWSSVSRVWRAVRRSEKVMLIHWNYDAFKNQLRLASQATSATNNLDAYSTHARGVFIDKRRRLFVVYEPRAFIGSISQWFDQSPNDFAKRYKSYTHLIVHGNQTTSSDCEKRVLRYVLCCFEKFRSSQRPSPAWRCRCGLEVTHTVPLYIRK